ncbi:MAG: MFS transporter [Victivallaceae bacterium]|nr:MFS transporter [Victivallaceae bacterium]
MTENKKSDVTFVEKTAFGSGNMNNLLMNNILNILLNPIYNVALGVSPALIGYATAIPRLWDAISDPIVGSLSDNFRSRWGRRKPFMLFGAAISALSLFAVWQVAPGWSEMSKFFYLIAISLVFYTGNTFFLVPYTGLGLALSDDYEERTGIFAYKAFFDTVGGLLLPWFYWFVTRDWFSDTLQGTRYLSGFLAIWLIVFALIPMMFCRERYDAKIATQKKVPILRGIWETMRNREFMKLTLAVTLMFFGFYAANALNFYLNVFYLFRGNESAAAVYVGINGTVWKLVSLVSLPVIVWLGHRCGKKATFIGSLVLGTIASISNFACWVPSMPWLQVVPQMLFGPGISCILLLAESMLADICDLDELGSGARREAMYGAIYGWFTKVGLTLAMAISGLLLVMTGFNVSLGVEQPESTFLWIRILNAVVPGIGMLVALFLMSSYSLNSDRMREVKQKLSERAGGC